MGFNAITYLVEIRRLEAEIERRDAEIERRDAEIDRLLARDAPMMAEIRSLTAENGVERETQRGRERGGGLGTRRADGRRC